MKKKDFREKKKRYAGAITGYDYYDLLRKHEEKINKKRKEKEFKDFITRTYLKNNGGN